MSEQHRTSIADIPFEAVSEWQQFAECAIKDPELFFDTAQTKTAKAICSRCVVVAQCLEYAVAQNERDGVWGGTTPTERNRMRGRQRARETRRHLL